MRARHPASDVYDGMERAGKGCPTIYSYYYYLYYYYYYYLYYYYYYDYYDCYYYYYYYYSSPLRILTRKVSHLSG